MKQPLDKRSLDLLFNEARTYNSWQNKPVDDSILKQIYDLTKMAPTSANCQPMRLVFVKSKSGKEKLRQALHEANIEKTMSAPVTAIIGMDMEFYEHLPELFPHTDARSWFAGNEQLIYDTAYRNSSMQGGYFILAARALGLDTGALSGFDNEKIDELFFAGTKIKSNFLCNIGYGDDEGMFARSPRPDFDKFCKIV